MRQTQETNPNSVLIVAMDGTVQQSNEAGEPLLHEWNVRVGEKLPSSIIDLVQRVISRNSPEKMDIKVGNKVYLVVFSPLPEQECVIIYGFDKNDRKKPNKKIQESEIKRVIDVDLAEIIDAQAIQLLMDDFYRLVQIPMSIVDLRGSVLVGTGWQDICTNFHRINPETCKQCIQSSTTLSGGVVHGEYKLYKCKNNMWHTATPIIVGGQHVGNIISGQFFFDDESLEYELFRSQARKFGFNEEDYIAAFEKIPRLSRETLNTGMSFFIRLANLISKLGYSNTKLAQSLSEREVLLETLRMSEEKYRNIVETTNEGIWSLDSEAQTTYVNEKMAEMLGHTQDEIIGRSLWNFVDGFFLADYKLNFEKRRKSISQVYESKLIRKDGSVLWTLISAKANFDKTGKFTGSLGMLTDITEQKKAAEPLKRTYESLEEKIKERTIQLEMAYKSLKESESGLAEAQKMAHIGNWKWDIAADKAYRSEEMYHIFGRDPQAGAPSYDEFLGYIHPDDRNDYENMTNKALNEKSSLNIDFSIISDNGEERRVYMHSEIVFNETNDPVQIKGIVRDITESEKTEKKIHHLANVVESSSDAIGTLSLEGITTSWNKGAEQIYGYSAEDILGQHISLPAPSNLKNETQKYVELIIQTGMSFRYTTSRLRKDGEMIDVSITLSPVFDSLGKLTAISFISRDITEQKRSEEKIRQSEEKYRNIVETANEGILIINDDNIITYVNKKMTDMLGLTVEEGLGKPIWGFITEEYRPIVKLHLEKRYLGISESYELKLIHKNGSPVWTFLNVKPLFDIEGKYIGAMSMFTDITKRKEAEQALAEIEIIRKREIHHRIKNNLQIISSLLDLQAEKFKDRKNIENSEVLKALRECQDRVISMALIHKELHKCGEVDTLNFSNYIDELADSLFLTYRLRNVGIYFNKEIQDDIFFNMDISVPLGIITNELISNSLKYAFVDRDSGEIRNGEIRIKLHREKNQECKCDDSSTTYVLSVSDNGIGIPEDLNIEDVDSLGLQLVTTLVDQLDGELELKRDNGTEFVIRFAVMEKNDQA